MRKLIDGIEQLPSAPASASRILELATQAAPNLNDLVECVESDPAVSLRLLRQANSSVLNRSEKVNTVRQAAMLLGQNAVCTLALCVSIREGLFKTFDTGDPLVREYWRHSLACACAGQLLAQHVRPAYAGVCFTGGLLHDCGKLALLSTENEAYAKLLGDEFLVGNRLIKAEQELLGADHCLAGKWLLERWGLPDTLVDATWMHHQHVSALLGMGEQAVVSLIVSLADRMAHEVTGTLPGMAQDADSLGAAAGLGLEDPAVLRSIRVAIGELFARRAVYFDLHEDAAAFYFNALGRANRRLGSANLGMAGKSLALERDAELLRSVALAGVDITKADSVQDVLAALAACMRESFDSPSGFAYVADPVRKKAEGQAWGAAGELHPVAIRLRDDLAPIAEDAGLLPGGIGVHLGECRIRASALAGPEGPPVHFQAGVAMVGVTDSADALGELLYMPKSGKVTPEERSAVSLLAQLTVQAFRRLELVQRCELRSERLAEVMRSMQDMNDKLLKTQRLAAVGQLAAGAAHEINNPLAIISARAQLLEMRETDPAKKKGLKQMVEQIERISAILGSLMDFARPATPRMEPMSPRDVMDRVLNLMEGSLTNQGVAVERDFQTSIPDIKADSRQVEQVLLNLVLNAQHAMEGRGGTLRAGLSYAPREDYVGFTVADTGTGIPKENLEKIFDPFFTTKGEGKGTGLGLSTAYGIVQAHKGRIGVESDLGKGTVFTVTLPRDLAGTATPPGPDGPRRVERQAVLVVDDERNIRDILHESLESKGYAVELAEDGDKALELMRLNRYQLMIMDIRMPSRDGLGLLHEASSFAEPSTPVIVLTGLASDEELREAKRLGAAVCLRKPFQVETLLAEAGRLLSGGAGS